MIKDKKMEAGVHMKPQGMNNYTGKEETVT